MTGTIHDEMVAEIANNRRAWRFTVIPQICIIILMIIALSTIAGYGLYIAVTALRVASDVSGLAKASQVFVGGGSSVLGFVVIRLFGKLTEISTLFIVEERRFTTHIGKVKLATSRATIIQVLEEYGYPFTGVEKPCAKQRLIW